MGSITNNNLSKLWIRMKSYINSRIEDIDASVDLAIDNAIANAGHMEMELLWENASPTSEFAAQTITVDLSQYTHYEVLCLVTNATYKDSIISSGIIPVNKGALISYGWGDVNTVAHRRITESTLNSITFGGASYNKTAGNSYVIPQAIYGIKGVK